MFRPTKGVAPETAGTQATAPAVTGTYRADGRPNALGYVLALARVALGWTFLWAFLDKTFGWGFATPAERAWVNGGSPTEGFLGGVEGPFAGFFNGMAGQAWADWLFTIGLLGIGVALILGIGMRIAAVAGVILLGLMYLAVLPLENNPVIDEHITEALLLVVLALAGAGRAVGLGGMWARLPFVRKNPWLT